MNLKFEKYEYLFPETVYRCPCLRLAIEECFLMKTTVALLILPVI